MTLAPTAWIPTLLTSVLLSSSIKAQAEPDTMSSSSKNYFLLNAETGTGGHATSKTYALQGSSGSGVVADRCTSKTFQIDAGFFGSADVSSTGQPWLAGVSPRFVSLRGKSQFTLSGTGLNLGTTPKVTVDGQPATSIGTVSRHSVNAILPALKRPGWLPVTLSTSAGTATLPRGIGVLPMVYHDPAPANQKAFELVFKGTRSDQVVWAIGIGPGPRALPIGGFHHGLEIHPALFVVMPGFSILGADGEMRMRIPATNIPNTLYVQALFASNNPDYAPGSFSNLVIVYP